MSYDYDDSEDDSPSEASNGSIKVSATTLEYDAQRMFDTVAKLAAQSIVKACSDDIRKAVRESVKSQIEQKVGVVIEKALEEGIQPVNSYGEPIGKSTTLKSLIGKAGEEYLGARVNERGETNSYGDRSTRLEYLVKKNVEATIDYKMQTQIKQAVEAAVAAAQLKVAEVVAKFIK